VSCICNVAVILVVVDYSMLSLDSVVNIILYLVRSMGCDKQWVQVKEEGGRGNTHMKL
jgi:hypothetical protein